VAAAVLSACGSSGNSVPSNAVASIDGTSITKADYTKWASITAKGSSPNGPAVVPDPPTYTNCIAALRKQTRPARGQPAPTDVTLRAQCRQQNDQIVQQTMNTLIQNVWVEKESKAQGVSVSDAEAQRQLAVTKRQSFPTEAAYQRFLKQSGMTQADVVERIRLQVLAAKLTRKIQSSAAPVTAAEIQSYYERNKAQFAVPERRDVELILTRNLAQANAAKAAVNGGMSWAAAAKKYSTDAASKATGGILRGVSAGQQDRAFDQASFTAKKGVIVGPVKGQFGYYVVRVTNIAPASLTSLATARAQIQSLLQQQNQQQKMAAFIRNFETHWRSKTNCRTGYVVQLCSNAPAPRTTPGTGASQSGAGTTSTGK